MKKALAVLSALLSLSLLCACGAAAGQPAEEQSEEILERTAASARAAADGAAYIVTESECYTVKSGLQDGYITPDRTRLVTLTESGELSYSDVTGENAVTVSDSAASVSDVRNDGFFYTSKADVVYRVRFGAEDTERLGANAKYTVAEHTTSVLYATTSGKLYLLACDTAEKTKAGSFEDSVIVQEVSDNGALAVWVLDDGEQYTPVIFNGGDKKTCESYSGAIYRSLRFPGFNAEFSKDQKLAVMGSWLNNVLYIAEEGKETLKVSLPEEMSYAQFYSEKGRIRDTNAEEINAVFVLVDASSGSSLYGITRGGEKERLLTNVDIVRIGNGRLFCLDEEGELSVAEIHDLRTEEGEKISGSAETVRLAQNGKYMYFTKNTEDGVATLCAYNVEEDSVKTVTNECAGKFYISTDGAAVFYFKDTQKIGDTGTTYGDLYRWDSAAQEAESIKIASDVLTDSLTSLFSSGEIDGEQFLFDRFDGKGEAGDIRYDLMRCRGGETETVQSDLTYAAP